MKLGSSSMDGNSSFEVPSFLSNQTEVDEDFLSATNNDLTFDLEKAYKRIGTSQFQPPSFSSDTDNDCNSTLSLLDCESENTRVAKVHTDFRNVLASYNKKRTSDYSFDSVKRIKHSSHSSSDISSSLSISSLKVQIRRMKAEHASALKALQMSKISLEGKINTLMDENACLKKKYSPLQLENKRLMEQILELHEQQQETALKKDALIVELKDQLESNSKMYQDTEEKLRCDLQCLDDENNILKDDNSRLNFKVIELSSRCEEADHRFSLLDGLDVKLTAASMEKDKLKQDLLDAQHEITKLNSQLSKMNECELQANAFKQELAELTELRIKTKLLFAENADLKCKKENYQMLNEKYIICQGKLKRMENRVSSYESEITELKCKLHDVEAASLSKLDVKSEIHYLEDRVAQLQKQTEMLEQKNVDLKEDITEKTVECHDLKNNLISLKQSFKDKSEGFDSLSVQSKRLKSKMSLLSQERDCLRSILHNYDAEMTMDAHKSLLSKRLEEQIETNGKLHIHIQNLEKQLETGKNAPLSADNARLLPQCAQIESSVLEDLKLQIGKLKAENHSLVGLQSEVSKLKEEKNILLNKIERLEALCEDRHLKGDFNPDTTKVVHFSLNPADVASQKVKSEIKELRTENKLLRMKIKDLEKGHEVSMSGIDFSTDYKDQLHRSELKNQRLKEAFSKKFQQLRNFIYMSLGYKVTSAGDGKYKVTSMYSEYENDYLMFEAKDNGTIELIETELSRTKNICELIELHLLHQNSFPVFLSAVTTHLFSQTTIME